MKFIPSKRPSKVTIPPRAHPAAKIVFDQMARQRCTYEELEHVSGVLKSTIKAWRTAKRPGLETLAACLGVFGWDLVPAPRPEHLPPELVEELKGLADRWPDQLEHLHPALIAAAARAHETWGFGRARSLLEIAA